MKEFKHVELFNEPSNVLERLNTAELESVTEMTDADRGFLCGLIRDHKPRKIVELGVAEGGTTAVILECIRELGLDCNLYSIDVTEHYYRDSSKKTGFILDELRKAGITFDGQRHTFFLGKILPEVLDEIGPDIDFLILDTLHIMPGENLDFLAVFPYLTQDAVVVMHDVLLSHRPEREYANCIATSVLFTAVTADKYFNVQAVTEENLDLLTAAFQLNSDTPKYLADVAAGLMLPWDYLPEEKHMEAYETAIGKLGPQFLALYKYAISNKMRMLKAEAEDWVNRFDWSKYRHVLLYGKGNRGKMFLQLCRALGVEISAFVVSDGRTSEKEAEGIPVYEYSSIPFEKENLLIVQTAFSDEISKRLADSDYHVLDFTEKLWASIYWWTRFQHIYGVTKR